MSALLERATSAIQDLPRERGDAFDISDRAALNIVRAVLLAVREPDDAMLQPGCAKHTPGVPVSEDRPDECPAFVRRRKVWANMIDTILAEEAGA